MPYNWVQKDWIPLEIIAGRALHTIIIKSKYIQSPIADTVPLIESSEKVRLC